ncbi:isoleucine--tRNA ligase [PVC group bacterium (ex Bugula neritina AB1)]|nr:isoleucine--tRNA ligase [PVC group bacterium (ex Bugula neritina AB1)]
MDYKKTLNLPQTRFSMKAGLPQKEPLWLEKWKKSDLYKNILHEREKNGADSYTLHDGPPYANGNIHMGHALNKVLKDIVVKYQTMKGLKAKYIPGWDCHGLPIEHQVMQKLRKKKQTKTPLEVRALCREYAQNFVTKQTEEFKRLGIWACWDTPYLTMDYSYEANIIRLFGDLVERGYVGRGVKPVHWCAQCETALAEAEIEYDTHVSSSVYVRLKCSEGWAEKIGSNLSGGASLIIWTTTPWTLPSNMAVAVHPKLDYVLVEAGGETFFVAKDLLLKVISVVLAKDIDDISESDYKVLSEIKGSQLEGIRYEPLFDEYKKDKDEASSDTKDFSVILADFVTAEDGTGCVHIAPGHGEEDFHVAQSYGLGLRMFVDGRGKYMNGAPDFLVGKFIFKSNEPIIEYLETNEFLLKKEEISHSYPHCWRCHKVTFLRATEQWFINVDHNNLRERVLEIMDDVKWVPEWGFTRLSEMVKNRPHWCISRQRAWGVPIPVFYCRSCSHTVLDVSLIREVAEKIDNKGCDVWYSDTVNELCSLSKCEKCGEENFDKETDILDVWFDSGASHYALLKKSIDLNFPAQLYLEGSDQHRGWFQSSFLLSVAGSDVKPFEEVLTHGFVVDGQGHKMSKSVGNVVSPQKLIQAYGADLVRLFVASSDYADDIKISDDIMRQKVDAYRKIRNTCRFLLGNTFDFCPEKDEVAYKELTSIDRWALSKLQILIERSTYYYENHLFHKFYQEIYHFCTTEMSSFYFDILKDRLYTATPKSIERLSSQTVMKEILITLTRLMAPIFVFTSEDIWENMPDSWKPKSFVHEESWPIKNDQFIDASLEKEWEKIHEVRDQALKIIEKLRADKVIGSSLEALLTLHLPESFFDLFSEYSDNLAMIFIVSEVKIVKDTELKIVATKINGSKCVRCWIYSPSVGENLEHIELCDKCSTVMGELL